MAVEIVLLVPVLMGFVLLVVMGGRYVGVRGDVDAAARDAVREASLATSRGDAGLRAQASVAAQLEGSTTCAPAALSGEWAPGGTLTVRLDCRVSYAGLGLLGVGGGVDVDAESSAPLDPYRSFG